MAQKALRHQDGREPQEFDVIKDNKDGTVDLGHGETVVIGSCIVSDVARPGTCTLVKTPKAPKSPKSGDKQPTAEEKAAALAEAKKMLAFAQEAAAAAPTDENLAARVKELTAAVEELEG